MDLETMKTFPTEEKLSNMIKTEILEELVEVKEEKFHRDLKKIQNLQVKDEKAKSISSFSHDHETKIEALDVKVSIKREIQDVDWPESSNCLSSHLEEQNRPSISTDYDHKHNKRFICIFCNKAYNYLSHLKKHMRTHSGEKPYTCEICFKNFRCKGTLKVHSLTHTGSKPFKCQVCEKEFQTSSNLKKHSLVHTDEKPYACDICHRKYRCVTQMKNHRMQHLGEKKYHCSFCDEKFGYLVSLKTHLLKHTGEVPPFTCDICNKSFKMSHHLKRHKETHIGAPFVCRKCNREFLQLRELQKHSSDCRDSNSFDNFDYR